MVAKMTVSVAIFNPYLDGLTGVVRLTFDVAKVFRKLCKDVKILTLGLIDSDILKKYHNVDIPIESLDNVKLKEKNIFAKILYTNRIRRLSKNLDLDLMFFTDGYYLVKGFDSIPKILYVYFPYSLSYHKSFEEEIRKTPIYNRAIRKIAKKLEELLIYKEKSVKKIVVYSNFVKSIFEENFSISPCVLMPPLNTNFFVPPKDLSTKFSSKEKTILCVTRFHPDKEHDIIVEAFTKYVKKKIVQLIIAGHVSDANYYKFIKNLASRDNRIRLVPNPSDGELLELYQEASLFWYVHEEHLSLIHI